MEGTLRLAQQQGCSLALHCRPYQCPALTAWPLPYHPLPLYNSRGFVHQLHLRECSKVTLHLLLFSFIFCSDLNSLACTFFSDLDSLACIFFGSLDSPGFDAYDVFFVFHSQQGYKDKMLLIAWPNVHSSLLLLDM